MKTVRLPAALWLAVAGYGALAQPEIGVQPADTSVSLGATAQFAVSVRVAASPLTYQWWFNDTALDPVANPSAARARLSLTNVTLGNAGAYYVVVSDTSGSIKSRTATLDVDPQFTKFTEGPVATDRVSSWSGHFGDYDGDGLMDLVVTGDYGTTGRNTRLYHNEGDGRFTAVTSGPWEAMTDRVGYGAWADTDNDGDLDLLLGVHESQTPFYLCNQGGGEFTRRPLDPNWFQPPVGLGGQTGTPVWGDLDNDGWLDGILQGPSTFPFRNLGNGQFTVLTNTPMYRLTDWAQSQQLVDYDNDGDLDVFLPLETSSAKLYRNDGQLRFTDVSTTVLQGRVPWGAGGSWADFDNDGDLDLISAGRDAHSGVFLVNNGDGTFANWQGSPAALATAGGNWGI
ncbi:MAG: VCBS repeat-containing protein, partial [Verrucomicrobiales bacterium]|nr:VCBS repeat-containing protein [Verrucomicrobiales bacterium]